MVSFTINHSSSQIFLICGGFICSSVAFHIWDNSPILTPEPHNFWIAATVNGPGQRISKITFSYEYRMEFWPTFSVLQDAVHTCRASDALPLRRRSSRPPCSENRRDEL